MNTYTQWIAGWALLLVTTSLSADWPQFRGPGGNGRSEEKNLPSKWSDTENIGWKAELPGPGTSSPIVVGDKVIVTAYSGYAATTDAAGDMEQLQRHLLCFDRASGKMLWHVKDSPELPESKYEGRNNTRHGYASSTPISDGEHLFVFFGRSGVLCFDLEGKQLWQTSVGNGITGWGSSNSPVLYKNLVIVNASVESGSLVALDKKTGQEKWRVKSSDRAWTTPLLVPSGDKFELVVNVPGRVKGFDPESGKELWNCEGSPDNYLCPSPIFHDGVIYVVCGRGGDGIALAIRPGGSGDVTDSHVIWKQQTGNRVPSPVYENGYLYYATDEGMLSCLNAKTGDIVFNQRINPSTGTVYASLVVADGKLYCVSQENGVYVFAAKPEYQLIAQNVMSGARANASPAIDNGNIFLRDDKFLYCVGPANRVARAK